MTISFLLVLLSITFTANADCGDLRPSVDQVPQYARWLVSHGGSGWLSTKGYDAYPLVHLVSYTDACTGYPLLYLSPSEPVRTDPHLRASLAIFESFVSGFAGLDLYPQITLTGKLRKLPEHSEECAIAEGALFEAHPALRGFPKLINGTYAVYKFKVDGVYLTGKGGMPKLVPLEDYVTVNVNYYYE